MDHVAKDNYLMCFFFSRTKKYALFFQTNSSKFNHIFQNIFSSVKHLCIIIKNIVFLRKKYHNKALFLIN